MANVTSYVATYGVALFSFYNQSYIMIRSSKNVIGELVWLNFLVFWMDTPL